MNAEQLQAAVAEVGTKCLDVVTAEIVRTAETCLAEYDTRIDTWAGALAVAGQTRSRLAEAKKRARRRLQDAKGMLERAEAELLLDARADGRINGGNEQTRKVEAQKVLAQAAVDDGEYGQAYREVRAAETALDQVEIEELGALDQVESMVKVAAERLAESRAALGLYEAQLHALSK